MKLANLLSDLSEKTGQFNAAPLSLVISQLEHNIPFLMSKSKQLTQKTLPPFEVAVKFSKNIVESAEVKTVIVKQSMDFIVRYLATTSIKKCYFVELSYGIEDQLKKIKK